MHLIAIDAEWRRRKHRSHRITQVAAVELMSNGERIPHFWAVCPDGLSRDQFTGFLEFVPQPFVWIGHNVSGDRTRVEKDYSALMLPRPLIVREACTLKLARKKWPKARNRLIDVARRLHVGREDYGQLHNALADAMVCASVYQRLAA